MRSAGRLGTRGPVPWAVAVAWCAALGWFAFVRGVRVPLLSMADFGFHELGHLVFYVVPVSELVTAMAGSGLQVLVPLGLAAYFALARHDPLAAACCGAWGATSMQDASVYIADAPHERLQLVGGEHDWAFALGPDGLDRLDDAARIAAAVRNLGAAVLLASLAVAVLGLATAARRGTAPPPTRPRVDDASVPRV